MATQPSPTQQATVVEQMLVTGATCWASTWAIVPNVRMLHADGTFEILTNKLATLHGNEIAILVDDFAVALDSVSVCLTAVDRALAG